jgi:hypothetical protein
MPKEDPAHIYVPQGRISERNNSWQSEDSHIPSFSSSLTNVDPCEAVEAYTSRLLASDCNLNAVSDANPSMPTRQTTLGR